MFVPLPTRKSLSAALLAIAALPAAGQLKEPSEQPDSNLRFSARELNYDGASGRMVWSGVQIEVGDYSIEAERGESSSLEFREATWFFRGNARFRALTMQMACDSAELRFEGGRLRQAIILGDPVTLSNEGDRVVEGQAPRIDYDAESALVRLSGGAVLESRETRVSGESIAYDLDKETFAVVPGQSGPVELLYEFFARDGNEET